MLGKRSVGTGTITRDVSVICAVHLPGHLVQFQRCKGATPKQHLEPTLRRLHVPPQRPLHQQSTCPHARSRWPCPHRNPSGELLHPYRFSASCRGVIQNICSPQCSQRSVRLLHSYRFDASCRGMIQNICSLQCSQRSVRLLHSYRVDAS